MEELEDEEMQLYASAKKKMAQLRKDKESEIFRSTLCACVCMCVCLCVSACVCMHIRMYVCVCARVCVCACVYTCLSSMPCSREFQEHQNRMTKSLEQHMTKVHTLHMQEPLT